VVRVLSSEESLIHLGVPFRVEKIIAHGASSTVYEALNEERGERVALKVFHAQLTEDPKFVARLQREADALKQIHNPHVVQLIQAWTHGERFFLELELVRGRTLKWWMREEPADWIEPRLWLLVGLARALGAAHQEQFVHRDLKPENILVSESGELKLTDFGLAKAQTIDQRLTQTGSLVGSLAYMAPETVDGRKATFASDIFSFGVVAYELLCGRHPFFDHQDQLQIRDLLLAKFTAPAQLNPRISFEIGELITQCLNKDEGSRPASIWRVESQLMEHLQRTGLLNLAKRAVETGGAATSLLPQALECKYRRLKTEITSHSRDSAADRKLLVARINEFGAHFPNDGTLPDLIKMLGTPKRLHRPRVYWALLALPFAIVFAVVLRWPVTVPPPAAPALVQPAALIPTAPQAIPAPAEAPARASKVKEPKLPPPAPKIFGTLKVITDLEVKGFLNGRSLSRAELGGHHLRPGTYVLRLEKPGFLPIEKSVTVTAGKITTVNTMGGAE
jgi:serine/threonine protein kinase